VHAALEHLVVLLVIVPVLVVVVVGGGGSTLGVVHEGVDLHHRRRIRVRWLCGTGRGGGGERGGEPRSFIVVLPDP
jgi:hypothetical protein